MFKKIAVSVALVAVLVSGTTPAIAATQKNPYECAFLYEGPTYTSGSYDANGVWNTSGNADEVGQSLASTVAALPKQCKVSVSLLRLKKSTGWTSTLQVKAASKNNISWYQDILGDYSSTAYRSVYATIAADIKAARS